MAIVQGAEGVDLDEEWYGEDVTVSRQKTIEIYDMPNLAATGLSLGYEKQ
jgi:hypothetical protein